MAKGKCQNYTKSTKRWMITEVLRYIILVIPVFLGAWRYAELRGYPVFISGFDVTSQYWITVSLLIIGATLLIYVPSKALINKYKVERFGRYVRENYYWRPSILCYIVYCGLPVFVLVLVAVMTGGRNEPSLDTTTIVILQVTVVGLTLTEWISKIREEQLTYDLVDAAANDFFFTYDVIDFVTMGTQETDIYQSNWTIACFIFAFIAMFKYVPAQPIGITGESGARCLAAVLTSMLCNDIPFLIIRLCTSIIYGFRVSDFLHIIKNIALIGLGGLQIYIIKRHHHRVTPPDDVILDVIPHLAPQTRRARLIVEEDEDAVMEKTSGWDEVRRRFQELAQKPDGGEGGSDNKALEL